MTITQAIYDIGQTKNQIHQMRETILLLMTRPELAFSAMHMIATFIGGLAKAERREDQKVYCLYLQNHFADLVKSISPEDFYHHFRNGAVHEMAVRQPFGLRHADPAKEYTTEHDVDGIKYSLLNVDRLTLDFLRHLDLLSREMIK